MATRSKSELRMKQTITLFSGSSWSSRTLTLLGILVEITESIDFFGGSLPEKFMNQTSVDEMMSLDITTGPKLLAEVNNPQSSKRVHDLLNSLYVCLFLRPYSEAAVDDFSKCLLRMMGFNESENLFIHGPHQLSLPLGMESNKASPDVVVMRNTIQEKNLLIQENKHSMASTDDLPEGQLGAEFLAAYKVNLVAGVDHGDLFGIIAIGSMLTFYKTKLAKGTLKKLRKCEKAEEGEEALLKIQKLKTSGEANRLLFMQSKENMMLTFKRLEATRLAIQET